MSSDWGTMYNSYTYTMILLWNEHGGYSENLDFTAFPGAECVVFFAQQMTS